jgi:RNA polymerase sigma-70 factor (ECF subfamily)
MCPTPSLVPERTLPIESTAPAEVEASRAQAPPARAANDARTHAELDRLMDRYATGDGAAFVELHRLLAPRLRMFLLRLCGQPRLADDLLQDTFLRIHRARGSFVAGAAVVAWSYAIARNVYIDHGRKRREVLAPGGDDEEPVGNDPAAPPGASPEATFFGKETLGFVREAIDRLPIAQREALILLRFEGLSVTDASLVLGTSEGNVKVRAFRAAEAIRATLQRKEQP